jgi:hypothetical protein
MLKAPGKFFFCLGVYVSEVKNNGQREMQERHPRNQPQPLDFGNRREEKKIIECLTNV